MRRIAFVLGGVGAMTVTALARPGRRALADEIVDYTLTSAPLTFSPSPAVRFAGLAYNGSIPGPLLRVTYGQRVRVRYRSAVDIPTSVHWHGMILPNEMDGAATVTQAPVLRGDEFVYEFAPGPPGTRWYHDHAFDMGIMRGLFGMFIVDDPRDEPVDKEFALVFHDVPQWNSLEAARRGISTTTMATLPGSPEAMEMMRSMGPIRPMHAPHGMGDEVAYLAHCVNGSTYPDTPKLAVRVGDTVRLRVLNASPTQTRYLRLAGHRLTVTHGDGNRLAQPLEVDAMRIGVAERYDALFTVTRPGAFLLQGLTAAPLARQQAVLVYTEGMENAPPAESPETLADVNYFTYEKAAGIALEDSIAPTESLRHEFALGGGTWGNSRWTINGKIWPKTPKIHVRAGDRVTVHFKNTTDMDHPMHLHGHAFSLVEVGGKWLARPLVKDVSLVPANGGTTTWRFSADSPPGRWLLHCHNDVHMMGGMMTEVVYD